MNKSAAQPEHEIKELVVRSADCQFADLNGRLMTYRVDSDIAVLAHVPAVGLSALVRFTQPESKADPEAARENPWMFADTALPLVLSLLRRYGAEDSDISLHAVGAVVDPEDEGSVTRSANNEAALRRVLGKEKLTLAGEDLGGDALRSIWFDAKSGRLLVRSSARRSLRNDSGLARFAAANGLEMEIAS